MRVGFDEEIGWVRCRKAGVDKIDSEIVGYFSFSEEFSDEEKRQITIRINGSVILYGILRGQIATFTGSFPNGKFNLPTVNMIEIVNEIEKKNIAKITKHELSQNDSKKTRKRSIKRKKTTTASVKK